MNITKPAIDYERYQKIVSSALPCKHPNRAVRYKRDKKGVVRLREQCPECGKAFPGELRHSVLNGAALDSVPPWDYNAEQRFLAVYVPLITAVAALINDERDAEWWRQYAEYLGSPEWHAIRRKVIEVADGMCEYCRIRSAIQVHHRTYERVGHEWLNDLQAVCMECHQLLHNSLGSFR